MHTYYNAQFEIYYSKNPGSTSVYDDVCQNFVTCVEDVEVVFGLVYVNLDDLFLLAPAGFQYDRDHKFKLYSLYKRQSISCVHANFFSKQVINCRNSLPHTVDLVPFQSSSVP